MHTWLYFDIPQALKRENLVQLRVLSGGNRDFCVPIVPTAGGFNAYVCDSLVKKILYAILFIGIWLKNHLRAPLCLCLFVSG